MKPIKPRYVDTVKVDWRIPKYSKQILDLYSKYTKYDEEYLIEKAINEILEDEKFVEWLNRKRYQKRIQYIVSDAKGQTPSEESESQEEELDF